MRGVVLRIPKDKETGDRRNFLFIKGEDGRDYFLHRSGLNDPTIRFSDIRERDRIEFTAIENDENTGKGPRAIEARIL